MLRKLNLNNYFIVFQGDLLVKMTLRKGKEIPSMQSLERMLTLE